MKTKFIFLTLATILLSGCTLLPSRENAATDTNSLTPTPVPSISAVPVEIDQVYVQSQTTSSGNDIESLEADLNKTLILDEDLSDILGE